MRNAQTYCKDEAGNIAVIFAGVLAPLVIVLGMSVDFGIGYSARTELQAAADSAVLAAAAPADMDASERIRLAEAAFSAKAARYGAEVSATVRGNQLTLEASSKIGTSFLRVTGRDELEVSVKATAQMVTASEPLCVLLLEPSDTGLYVNSNSTLDADCGIHVNSTAGNGVYVNSDSHVIAASTCVVGGAFINGGGTVSPAADTGCPIMADPLAGLPEPPEASDPCDYTDFTVNNGEIATMLPGVYCKKTLINSGGSATMLPGLYVFRGGEFEINSNSEVSGDGVMLYFADKDARLQVNSDSTFRLSSQVIGEYRGVLMFQSRAPETLSASSHVVNSDSLSKLQGTIYLPNGVLEVNSLSDINQQAAYTSVIARKMILNSFGRFYIRSDYNGGTPLPPDLNAMVGAKSVRLVQ